MSLTPEDIEKKRFHDAFRGYNHEEVDVFLDEVAASFQAFHRQIDDAGQRIQQLEGELEASRRSLSDAQGDLEEVRGTEGLLKRTLIAAQRAADEAIAEAEEQSSEIVSKAKERAAQIEAEATRRASAIVAGADAEIRELEERNEELRTLYATHHARLKDFMEGQLRALGSLPPPGGGPPGEYRAARVAPDAGPDAAPRGPGAAGSPGSADGGWGPTQPAAEVSWHAPSLPIHTEARPGISGPAAGVATAPIAPPAPVWPVEAVGPTGEGGDLPGAWTGQIPGQGSEEESRREAGGPSQAPGGAPAEGPPQTLRLGSVREPPPPVRFPSRHDAAWGRPASSFSAPVAGEAANEAGATNEGVSEGVSEGEAEGDPQGAAPAGNLRDAGTNGDDGVDPSPEHNEDPDDSGPSVRELFWGKG